MPQATKHFDIHVKGKAGHIKAESEDKPKDDCEIVPNNEDSDDGIVGDGPETLLVSRSMLAPKEVEDSPKIEEINGDGDQPLVIRRDPLVSANIGGREQIDQWMDLFRAIV